MSSRDVTTVSFEQFFWSSSDLMSVVDLDGNFVLVNPAYRHILGWEPEELIGQSYRDYFHPDDLDRVTTAFAPRNGVVPSVVELDLRERCRDGSYRWMKWTISQGQRPVLRGRSRHHATSRDRRRVGRQHGEVARDLRRRRRFDHRHRREPEDHRGESLE